MSNFYFTCPYWQFNVFLKDFPGHLCTLTFIS